VPVLALFGALDSVVPPAVNAPRLEQALRRAGNQHVTVTVFPGANHHFLTASTGGPAEVSRLSGYVEGYFETRMRWLEQDVAQALAARDLLRADTRLLIDRLVDPRAQR
jgi:dienelactone hydrolase